MAILSDLPPELVEMILHGLGSIDDVHNMGITCKKTYDVIRRSEIYMEIMRSVIGCAPQHRYDLQLCKMLSLHQDIVEHVRQHSTLLPTTQGSHQGFAYNKWESALVSAATVTTCDDACCAACLPDNAIHGILARYQGLRVLEDLWLERQLKASDFFIAEESSGTSQVPLAQRYTRVLHRNELYRDGKISSRRKSTPETAGYTSLNADQRARFYSAVVCVWLFNELRWVLTNFRHASNFDMQIRLLETCRKHILKQSLTPLLDELDRCAVFRFMYHHLLPVYGACLADQATAALPFTFSTNFGSDYGYTSRLLQLFISSGETYLQPPDLIELVLHHNTSREPPWPLSTFSASTQAWQHPSPFFAFPTALDLDLLGERHKRAVLGNSLTHLNMIARSSIHQTSAHRSPVIAAPPLDKAYRMRDLAGNFYLEGALIAFEKHEDGGAGTKEMRKLFPERWGEELWSVWWWANSEDKARAKMERWKR
ncbi:hypothetical protein ACEQ8H_005363 [Pleosporales sp. CAS-2024a]